MSKSLVIVESPAKAKTIEKFLGAGYVVKASFGHVRDLPTSADEIPAAARKHAWARLGVDVEHGFAPLYVIPADKARHIKELRAALKGADAILLATDEDREGEAISWHLLEVLKPTVPVQRIVFHEITKEAILAAVASPRKLDTNLVSAQETRRILDRLYGYTLSPVLWKKVMPGLSAGRVQSVAVRLLVLRERERMAFHAASYWDLEALVATAGDETFPATLSSLGGKRLATGKDFDPDTGTLRGKTTLHLQQDEAWALAEVLEAGTLTVTEKEVKPQRKYPAPPFSTSTLQQESNRKLGFGAKRTMQIAQQLYEGIDIGGERTGLITYMRTDSLNLAESALQQAQKVIREMYGPEYATGPRRFKTKARGAQEAHEAIRPTSLHRTPQSMERVLDREQLKLYELIWKRTLASQMAEAQLEKTAVALTVPTPSGEAEFRANGSRIVFAGFLRAYVEGSDDPLAALEDRDVLLPKLEVGERTTIRELSAQSHETQPPARYTEASLVKRLEEEGIGRPSTYATIISTIQDRGYSVKQGGALVPTFTAFAVTELLEKHFSDLVDLKFTAKLEEQLDDVAEGKLDGTEELRAFYLGSGSGSGLNERVEQQIESIAFPSIAVGASDVAVRIGRFGPYLQRGDGSDGKRASVPEGVSPADLTLEEAEKLLATGSSGGRALGTDPASGKEVSLRSGRFGPYVQLGEDAPRVEKTESGKKRAGARARVPKSDAPKPKRASLREGMSAETLTLEQALDLLSYPRVLGAHPDSKEEVLADNGRYGPYVRCGKDFRSIVAPDELGTITLERALALLAAPKASRFGNRSGGSSRTALRELGDAPSGGKVQIFEGRFGPYITDGTRVFASVPKGRDIATITLEEAVQLIAEKAAKGPSKGRGRFARRGAAPKTTRRVVKAKKKRK